MKHCSHSLRVASVTLAAVALIAGASLLQANESGRTGKAQSANGCNCHGSTHSTGVTVTITGPQTVAPSSKHSYTVSVSGGPTVLGGFNLKTAAGTLTAGPNTTVSGLEVTHSNGFERSWTFDWTAPATVGTQNFYAIAVAADGSGDEAGDEWNWYGGAVNTAFAISVNTIVPTRTTTWGQLKALYH
jgi:hypothetical protein